MPRFFDPHATSKSRRPRSSPLLTSARRPASASICARVSAGQSTALSKDRGCAAGMGSCEGEKSSAHHEARERSYGDREWGAWQSAAQHRVTVWAQTNASGEVPAVFELTDASPAKKFESVRSGTRAARRLRWSLTAARPPSLRGRARERGRSGRIGTSALLTDRADER